METSTTSTQSLDTRIWTKVASTNLKPPEGIASGYKKINYKNTNTYKPISIMKMVSGIKPKAIKSIYMGVTPFKLGCRLGEFKVDIYVIIEEILGQIGEIKSCFEVYNKRAFLFLKFKDENSEQIVKNKEIKFA
ncbi:hypothetical protein AYI70_g2324 [Smittium culicis]|uniref:Uncharacterized protein n=1 Tax=Smittium culicis TaxID=133412 RepID=A0A1R1Y8Q9_9FUNG|nr:hypothetical protein AYI70_g2324 [Smittium culicis]